MASAAVMGSGAGGLGGDPPSPGRGGAHYNPGKGYNWDDSEDQEESEMDESGKRIYHCRFCGQLIQKRRTNLRRHHVSCHGRQARKRADWSARVRRRKGAKSLPRGGKRRESVARSFPLPHQPLEAPRVARAGEALQPPSAASGLLSSHRDHTPSSVPAVQRLDSDYFEPYPLWPLTQTLGPAQTALPNTVSAVDESSEFQSILNDEDSDTDDTVMGFIPDGHIDPDLPLYEVAPSRQGSN
ncbi:hypothetical protein QBC41DRAFT_300100 [Cercophora samala]|uniref:Uncharacterized protein n=1 Tax=Cercophora samala TaxID=330535 RepID=A0AA40DCX0_9PEZI|nr:hypothetical protein QBC41DRAFT_300100 [Cercophora samala]